MAEYVAVTFRAEVFSEGDDFVAVCPGLDVSRFGDSVTEAEEPLREAVEAFMEGCQSLGTLDEVLEEAGFRQHFGLAPSPPLRGEGWGEGTAT